VKKVRRIKNRRIGFPKQLFTVLISKIPTPKKKLMI
jgi:hypothetical protein